MKKLLLSLSLIASFSNINAQWTAQSTGFAAESRGLSEIRIIDANTAWALAYDGSGGGANVQEFTRTIDGTNWNYGPIAIGDDTLEINNLSPISASTAWVSAIINVGGGNPTDGVGFIFKTSDDGVTWEQQLFEGFQEAGSSFLNSVYFFNANDGVAYGDPLNGEFEIYTTSNGGVDWTLVPGADITNPASGEYGYNSAPTAIGNTIWFPTNKGRLFKSVDKGLHWTAYQAPLTDFGAALPANSGNVHFSTASNGCLLKTSGTVATPVYSFYRTTDGGQTWSASSTFTGTRKILNYIPGTNTIVATSQVAPVGTSVSIDNGTTWTDVESDAQRGASAFLNATTGWSAGFSGADPLDPAGIYKLTGQLGVPTVETAKFKVYPNPASATVTISTPEVDSYKLSVTDLSGKVVMTKSLNGIENTLDISALSTGAYFFEINTNTKKEVVKILKN